MEKTIEKWREYLIRQEEEHKARIPQLTEFWINKGHQILSEDKWADWDRCVPIRLGDLYHGRTEPFWAVMGAYEKYGENF